MTDQGREPRIEALRTVLTTLEHCLGELDQLNAGVSAPRLAHAIDDLRDEVAQFDEATASDFDPGQRALST